MNEWPIRVDPLARGLLVALEGCDGAGTTTQARLLAETLAQRQIPHHLTRQPSEGPVGRMIREILAGQMKAPTETIALLFAADRIDHLEREVWPALDAGKVVISDRWYHSSFAYNVEPNNLTGQACLQGGVLQDARWIREINAFATRPDVTFLLDIDAEEAARRRVMAGRATELYDDLPTQRAVVQRYRQLYSDDFGIRLINGAQPVGEVARLIYVQVESMLAPKER